MANDSINEVIAIELAEIKARQQAINELILIFFEALGGWAASVKQAEFTPGEYSGKYLEFYDHYREKYRQEITDQMRFAAEDEDGFVS